MEHQVPEPLVIPLLDISTMDDQGKRDTSVRRLFDLTNTDRDKIDQYTKEIPPTIQISAAVTTTDDQQSKSTKNVNKELQSVPPWDLNAEMKNTVEGKEKIEEHLFKRERRMNILYTQATCTIEETKECLKQQQYIFAVVEAQGGMNCAYQRYIYECIPIMRCDTATIPEEKRKIVEDHCRQVAQIINDHNDVNILVRKLKSDDRKFNERVQRHFEHDDDKRNDKSIAKNGTIIRLPKIPLPPI